jgi:hypothetical protein
MSVSVFLRPLFFVIDLGCSSNVGSAGVGSTTFGSVPTSSLPIA